MCASAGTRFWLALLLATPLAAQTVTSISVSQGGAIVANGTTGITETVTCTYSGGSPAPDNCTAAGGATWSSPTAALQTSNGGSVAGGAVQWSNSFQPTNASLYPAGAQTAIGLIHACAQGICDTAYVLAVPASTPINIYITPSAGFYENIQPGSFFTAQAVVGSQPVFGAGFTYNSSGNGNPIQFACNWTSSNTSIATINRFGVATAVSPGTVTMTCNMPGNVTIDESPTNASQSFTFTVTNPTPTLQTWYVRPDGGTPYYSAGQTPSGQCDGKHDASYASTGGTGVNKPCAFDNLRDFWIDEVTANNYGLANSQNWIIGPGDTVIVRQKTGGYNLGLDQLAPAYGGTATVPINCGNPDCWMPTIPSGTAAHHTQILGENFGSCTADSAKTVLQVTWSSRNGLSINDSQYVDIACFQVTQPAVCGFGGSGYTTNCKNSTLNYGLTGIRESAFSSNDTVTDVLLEGMAFEGVSGATGAGLVFNRLHIRGAAFTGIDMDDTPYGGMSNISVAGGLTMNNSITEFTGCVEERPIVHNFPYTQCIGQEGGGQGDGFGTASTTGGWSFNNDIWRFNLQDGLDLLHSGMQTLSVTNSQSYGNIGNQFKLGSNSGLGVFQNNYSNSNCQRDNFTIGDQPSGSVNTTEIPCRAGGTNLVMLWNAYGTYTVQNNTFVGYGTVAAGVQCDFGSENCTTSNTTFQNNVVQGSATAGPSGTSNMSAFCTLNVPLHNDCDGTLSAYPPNQGWATRSNNWYNGMNHCPLTVLGTESCNAGAPGFSYNLTTNELPYTLAGEQLMDPYNFNGSYTAYLTGTAQGSYPASGSSAIAAAGTPIAGLTLDSIGFPYNVSTPSIGNLQFQSGVTPATTIFQGLILKGLTAQ